MGQAPILSDPIAKDVCRSVRQRTFALFRSSGGRRLTTMFGGAPTAGRRWGTVVAGIFVEKVVKSKQIVPTRDGMAVVATRCDAQPDLMSTGARSDLENELAATSDSQAGWTSVSMSKWEPPTAADRRADKIRSWRRRALLKRGARLHITQAPDALPSSLAMLDEAGMVVCWYACSDGDDYVSAEVVDRHLSLFYVPEEVARQLPHRDLRAAVIEGRITRKAWRRRPDGSAVWRTMVIDPVVLRDGRVQGFSLVTRCS